MDINKKSTRQKLPPKAKYKTRMQALREIEKRENCKKEDSLPVWVYCFSITALVIVLIVLISKQ